MRIFFNLILLTLAALPLTAETFYYAFGKKVYLQPLTTPRALGDTNDSTVTWYRTQNGQKMGVRNEVIIGCDDEKACRDLLKGYPVTKAEKLSDTLYLLRLKKGSDPFAVANRLHEEPVVRLAHPNFIKKRQMR